MDLRLKSKKKTGEGACLFPLGLGEEGNFISALSAEVGPDNPSSMDNAPNGGFFRPDLLHLFFHGLKTPWPAEAGFFCFFCFQGNRRARSHAFALVALYRFPGQLFFFFMIY